MSCREKVIQIRWDEILYSNSNELKITYQIFKRSNQPIITKICLRRTFMVNDVLFYTCIQWVYFKTCIVLEHHTLHWLCWHSSDGLFLQYVCLSLQWCCLQYNTLFVHITPRSSWVLVKLLYVCINAKTIKFNKVWKDKIDQLIYKRYLNTNK